MSQSETVVQTPPAVATPPHTHHAQTMDTVYRYQRYIYDVTRRYYLFGRNEMLDRLNPLPGADVLEVGCGTARNLIETAHRYPHCQLYGFDISSEMLKTAADSVSRAKLASRITLAEGDATAFDGHALFGVRRFDRIFISYSLSMIPGWRDVIEGAARQLAPGGKLAIVDFGNMAGLPRPARAGMHMWLSRFHVTPRADLIETTRTIAARHRLTAEAHHGRFGYAVHVTLHRA